MALSVSIALVAPGYVRSNISSTFVLTVTNPDSVAKSLLGAFVYESTESDATIVQPNFLTGNLPVGVGNPIIGANSSVSYPFQVVFTAPAFQGVSVGNPGDSFSSPVGQPADAYFTLIATASTSTDGTVSSSLSVPVLSSVTTLPLSQGGALQFSQGGNLMSLAFLGAL